MNIKRFAAGFACIFYLFIGLPATLLIAVYPQISWKISLLVLSAVSLITTAGLFIAGRKNSQGGFPERADRSGSEDTDRAYRIRPLLLAIYVFIVAIILAYITDKNREWADLATSATYAACWIFVWGWTFRLMEYLRNRRHRKRPGAPRP